MKPTVLIFLVPLICATCKKQNIPSDEEGEKHIITIEDYSNHEHNSSEYLMAIPGSWWKYSNGETWTCPSKDTIPIYTVDVELPNALYIIKDQSIIPYHPYFGSHKGRFGILNEWYHDETIYQPIYDITVGQFYEYSQHVNSPYYSQEHRIEETRKVLEVLNSYEVNNEIFHDVLHIRYRIKKFYYGNYMDYVPDEIIDFYLAKNVGLIKLYHQDGTDITDISLTDFYISE